MSAKDKSTHSQWHYNKQGGKDNGEPKRKEINTKSDIRTSTT